MSIVDYKADIDQLEGFRTTLTKENIRRAQLLAEATQQHQNATKLLEKTRSENAEIINLLNYTERLLTYYRSRNGKDAVTVQAMDLASKAAKTKQTAQA